MEIICLNNSINQPFLQARISNFGSERGIWKDAHLQKFNILYYHHATMAFRGLEV